MTGLNLIEPKQYRKKPKESEPDIHTVTCSGQKATLLLYEARGAVSSDITPSRRTPRRLVWIAFSRGATAASALPPTSCW
jgi:hypothetical protein